MAMTQQEYEEEVRRRLGDKAAEEWLRLHPTPGLTIDQARGLAEARQQVAGTASSGPFSLTQAQRAIERAASAGRSILNAPGQFDLRGIREAMEAARSVGGSIPVPEARFQDPEGIANLIGQMQAALQPLTEAELAAREAAANRRMQELRNVLGAQGSLAGGGAVAQMLAAEEALRQEQDLIRERLRAEAIGLGFDAARLGLSEAGLLFGMHESNRDFAARQAQQYVENLLRGLGAEEDMRRYRAGFEADLAQQYVQNLLAGLGMQDDIRARRFDEALREAALTGMYQGAPTLAARQLEAEMTGMWNGQPTFNRLVTEAGLTGFYLGQPTLERLLEQAELTGRIPQGFEGAGSPTFYAQQALRQVSRGGGSTTSTLTERRNRDINELASQIRQRKNQGDSLEDVLDFIIENAPRLPATLTLEDAIQLARNVYSGFEPDDDNAPSSALGLIGSGTARSTGTPDDVEDVNALVDQILRQRPWWQRLIDAIIPGPQYR